MSIRDLSENIIRFLKEADDSIPPVEQDSAGASAKADDAAAAAMIDKKAEEKPEEAPAKEVDGEEEEKEQSEREAADKEYLGSKDGDQFFYLFRKKGSSDQLEDLQVLDAADEVKLSAKELGMSLEDVKGFVVEAIRKLEMSMVAYEIVMEYIFPEEELKAEKNAEGRPDDEIEQAEKKDMGNEIPPAASAGSALSVNTPKEPKLESVSEDLSDEDRKKGFTILKITGRDAKSKQNVVPAWMDKLEDDKEYSFLLRSTPFGTFWLNTVDESKINEEVEGDPRQLLVDELVEKGVDEADATLFALDAGGGMLAGESKEEILKDYNIDIPADEMTYLLCKYFRIEICDEAVGSKCESCGCPLTLENRSKELSGLCIMCANDSKEADKRRGNESRQISIIRFRNVGETVEGVSSFLYITGKGAGQWAKENAERFGFDVEDPTEYGATIIGIDEMVDTTPLLAALDDEGFVAEMVEESDIVHFDLPHGETRETIKKVGSKWRVVSHKGRNLGTYGSRKEAEKRLRQVEFFKHQDEAMAYGKQPADAKAGKKVAAKTAKYHKEHESFGLGAGMDKNLMPAMGDVCAQCGKKPTKYTGDGPEEFCSIECMDAYEGGEKVKESEIYKGSSCPKCGHGEHTIPNASQPTINKCTECGYMWNPDNERWVGECKLHEAKVLTAIIIPYEFEKWGSDSEIVWVDKKNMSPDPSKMMLWGRSQNDPEVTISDFKGFFFKKGEPVEIEYMVPGQYSTAMQEQKARVEAIKNWIRSQGGKVEEVSGGLKKWRKRQKKGAIMKPSTFKKIEKSAAAKGAKDPAAVAGAAYWKTAKAKYHKAKESVKEDFADEHGIGEEEESKGHLYIVRHGKTALNQEGDGDRIRGWKDVPLDEEGKEEAKRLAEDFKGLPVDKIYSSDLSRCKDVAQAISDADGAPLETTQALRPWHLGKYEGQESKKIADELMDFVKNNPEKPVDGGESFEAFKDRYLGFLKEVMEEVKEGKNILLVTHYRAIKLAQAWVAAGAKENVDFDEFAKDSISTACAFELEEDEEGNVSMEEIVCEGEPEEEVAEGKVDEKDREGSRKTLRGTNKMMKHPSGTHRHDNKPPKVLMSDLQILDVIGGGEAEKVVGEGKDKKVEVKKKKGETEVKVKVKVKTKESVLTPQHMFAEFPCDKILAAIKALGEEDVAGFSGVTEDDIEDILAMLEPHELGEIHAYLTKGE